MVLSINSNFAAVNAQTNVAKANDAVSRNIAQLSSGQRITQAKDDVAGLAIGTSLKTGVSTLKAAVTNTAQASALLGLADGAVNSISDILARQKSLASQATAGTLNEDTRGFLDQEFQALSLEINRIAGNANFNGIKLLDGSASGDVFATGNPTDVTKSGTEGTTALTGALTLGGNFKGKGLENNEGKLPALTVTHSSANNVLFSMKIGDKTYSSVEDTTDLGSNTDGSGNLAVTLSSGNDGDTISFTINDNVATTSTAINDQALATALADAINADLNPLSFQQTRSVTSFSGTGTASGATAKIDATTFDAVDQKISDIQGTFNSATSSTFSLQAGNEVFTASVTPVGGSLAAGDIELQGNDGRKITVTTSSAVDLSDQTNVDTFVNDLKASFGVGSGLSFQTGVEAANTINVTLGDVQTASLYKDDNGASQSIDVKTLENAQTAGNVLDNAIKKVIAERATIGALQSRFDFAQSALKTSLTNQDSARAVFLDTDVSETSTEFALNNVKLQAGVSVQAQANQQTQNLLKLIG